MRPRFHSTATRRRTLEPMPVPATIRIGRRLPSIRMVCLHPPPRPMSRIVRRAWFVAALVALGGCSSATKKKTAGTAKKSRSLDSLPGGKKAAAWNRKHRPQGPQTFGNLLEADNWIADLDSKSSKTRITAAKQLGSMGKGAQSALPKLEKLAKDRDAEVAAAAQQAIKAIRK